MKACCPACGALCSVTPGRFVDGKRREYNPEPHPKPVCRRCRSRVNFEARTIRDRGTWVCVLCSRIPESDVDTTTGPTCKGKVIQ